MSICFHRNSLLLSFLDKSWAVTPEISHPLSSVFKFATFKGCWLYLSSPMTKGTCVPSHRMICRKAVVYHHKCRVRDPPSLVLKLLSFWPLSSSTQLWFYLDEKYVLTCASEVIDWFLNDSLLFWNPFTTNAKIKQRLLWLLSQYYCQLQWIYTYISGFKGGFLCLE